ncbi:peptidyl-prolyl cis-trans isomerase [Bacillus kexueae]|uniref:peptidyl-prolyl cis-trans isomerase n=1 Tax=Aeribacillus kexueae TaxID=2078952 RepID=UPI001FAFD470|nr:peptidyl-prolyl cis-trans isomerase [Bacillus kexueae]
MKGIIPIIGNVKFSITLDPGVWIFDDRKIDLDTYFETEEAHTDLMEEYIEKTAKHWEREIREGAVYPPTLKTERKYEKEKVLNGTFGIHLEPFIQNAQPLDGANKIKFHTLDDTIELSLENVSNVVLAFSKKGRPLVDDGPVHLYFADGSNRQNPVKNIQKIEIS